MLTGFGWVDGCLFDLWLFCGLFGWVLDVVWWLVLGVDWFVCCVLLVVARFV